MILSSVFYVYTYFNYVIMVLNRIKPFEINYRMDRDLKLNRSPLTCVAAISESESIMLGT